MRSILLVAAALGILAIMVVLDGRPAAASPGGLALELARGSPAVGPGHVDSFTVTCSTSATEIRSSLGPMVSYSCQTPASAETGGTVLVAVGDSGIGDPAFATRTSPVYSGDTIREWGGNAKAEYCRADTGTVTIFCRGLIAVPEAP